MTDGQSFKAMGVSICLLTLELMSACGGKMRVAVALLPIRIDAAAEGDARADQTDGRAEYAFTPVETMPRRSSRAQLLDVAAQAKAHKVYEPCRAWTRPSDHVPLMTEFEI